MTVRRPLVLGNRGANELATGDTLYGIPVNVADYVIAGFQSGVGSASLRVVAHCIPNAVTLPSGLAGSVVGSFAAATASTVFTLSYVRSGTTTAIATITFAAASKVGTISGVTIPTLQAGDVLQIVGPSTADTTLADVYFSILASKQ